MTSLANSPSRELDARGLNCPLPVLKARGELNSMNTGEVLKMISSDAGSMNDIPAFCKQTGNGLLSSSKEGGDYIFFIRKT